MTPRVVTPWIRSRGFDLAVILAPAWIVSAAVLLLPDRLAGDTPVGPGLWLLLVVGLDVAHVYATLFRTYFDRRERRVHAGLLYLVPLFCWCAAALVYSLGPAYFWTGTAYLAVFHFIRQQYGLMMLYGTQADRGNRLRRWLDGATVAMATLYPLVYWHAHLPRAFSWFVEGDFLPLPPTLAPVVFVIYATVLLAYAVSHAWRTARGESFNIPRQAIVLGSAVSWYLGIVAYDSDVAFTLTNVVSHAVPYFGLIWIYGENRERQEPPARRHFVPALAPALFLVLVGLAYLEEGFWDGLYWRDHPGLFPGFVALPTLGHTWQMLVVPLLMLPQLTHYVLDAFIWRIRSEPYWRGTLLLRRGTVAA